MVQAVLKEVSEKSFAGTITFPEVVKTLLEAGVESYTVDLIQNLKTHYLSNGEVIPEPFKFYGPAIPLDFSAAEVVAAIRASQAGQIKYREFLNRVMSAGCSVYTAYLTSKKVIYFGHTGDFHTESFAN